jgi:hypothetical protein
MAGSRVESWCPVDLVEATEKAITAARHLTDMDAGAVQALRDLARKIEAWDQIVDWALDDAADREGARPVVPANDNVSLPSYLKFCESLGLTPAGRLKLGDKKEPKSGTLTQLRSAAPRRAG